MLRGGRHWRRRPLRGLTLLELGLALAVASVLAAAAYPAWRDQMHKGRRVDAQVALASLQLAQERHRWTHGRYADHVAHLAHPLLSPAAHYELSVAHADHSGYSLLALPHRGSPQQSDRTCTRMALVVQAGVAIEMAASDGHALEPDALRRCWAP